MEFMALALLASRVLLAVVFVVAGVAKLADRPGSRQALINFGVPPRLATPVGQLLPIAELAVGLALVPRPTAWWGALGALALLLSFIGAIGYNLAKGRAPECHCFGQLHSSPAGWPTLARNSALALVAGSVLWQGHADPGLSALSWLSAVSVVERAGLGVLLLVAVALVAQGWLLVHTLQQNGRLLTRMDTLETRLETTLAAVVSGTPGAAPPAPAQPAQLPPAAGLPVGSTAPAFRLGGLFGETLTLEALCASGKPVVLVFSDPGCGPCSAFMPEVARYQRDYAHKVSLAVISRGPVDVNREKASEHGLTHVLLQRDREVATSFRAWGTPAAVLIRPDGTIGSAVAQGAEGIRSLVATVVGLPALAPLPMAPANANGNGNGAAHALPPLAPVKVGDAAPALSLPDLSGKTVSLAGYRGSTTLLLFWNPGCGFCQRMLDDLRAWEAEPPDGAPKLLVISTGAPEANRAMGLKSPVLMASSFSAAQAYGAGGTPSAVLIDPDGTVASEVAVGAPAVLALAGVVKATV
jgi:peroxiredoxin/uncharacterized membrane protein YphA (DoxX/SURF4 family)